MREIVAAKGGTTGQKGFFGYDEKILSFLKV
jgi:hypothetical protein